MINPNLLSDSLAAKVASEVIYSKLEKATIDYLTNEIMESASKELLDVSLVYVEELKRKVFFEKLFKSLESHEKKIGAMIIGIWEEQRKIIISNLKKMKKTWLEKDVIDQILYPRKQFEVKITKESKPLFESLMEERGNEEWEKIETELRKRQKQVDVGFDVTNPEVQSWLNTYTPKFSNSLEAVSTSKLRTQLMQGIGAGEGIPQLTKRINGTYANWNKFRSEAIARSEAIRASNQGALESYRQSGVVKSKVWVTHLDNKTCASCRRLDGKVIALEKTFFNKGDPAERITVGETTQTFKNDYEDISAPPRHTRCRCSIAANFKDMGEIKPYVIDATGPRARKVGSLKKALDELPGRHVNRVGKFHIDTTNKINANVPSFKGQNIAGYWDPLDKSIHFNAKWMDKSTVFHEVGHAVKDTGGFIPLNQKPVWTNWFKKAKLGQIKYPSQYALTNESEFFAENYSHYYQKNYNLIDDGIKKWFDKTGGF